MKIDRRRMMAGAAALGGMAALGPMRALAAQAATATARPEPADRLFASPAVEREIARV